MDSIHITQTLNKWVCMLERGPRSWDSTCMWVIWAHLSCTRVTVLIGENKVGALRVGVEFEDLGYLSYILANI